MGQEILHCSVCGLRLRSTDFDRGEALKIDLTSYCRKCAPEAAPSDAGLSSSSSARRRKTSTARIPIVTPRRAMEAAGGPESMPPAVLWGAGGLLAALVIAAAMVLGGRDRSPAPPPVQPAPETVRRPAAMPSPAPTVSPGIKPPPVLEKTARVEPAKGPVLDPRSELAEIDRKVAAATAQEKFREGFDLLTAAKGRIDTLEWISEIQKRSRDLDAKVKTIHVELVDKLEQARKRGADAEAVAIVDRIAKWDLPAYAAPIEKPVAAAVAPPPAEPTPAVAPATAPPPPVAAAPPSDLIPFVPGSRWTLLTPKRVTASDGGALTPLEDGSILASGPAPAKCRYSIVVQTDLKGISGFRIEALPHSSLPMSGPGRHGNGNFLLSEVQVQVLADPAAASGTPVVLERLAAADLCQDGFSPNQVIDGNKDTGWAILPQVGKAHELLLDTKNPLSSAGALTLLIVLDHQSLCEGHEIGRFRISATASKGAALEMATRVPVIDASRVDQAIRRGIAWLRTVNYPSDYDWSANELILWTFVHAGVPESDAEFQKRLKQMLESPLDRTYRVALQAMILEELDRVAYQFRIWQCAQFLIDNQCLNGQWHYGAPTEMPKGVPTPAKAPVPTAAKVDADGRRSKPKVRSKMLVRKLRDGPAEGDNSNSQYAALGLRACFDAGVAIPEETIHRAVKWWIESQYFDEKKEGDYASKGWSYTSPAKDPRPYHAMTVGGISSLTIFDYMLGREWKKSTPVKAGINWIAQNWTISSNYYYLYGLERAGILYGNEKFGRYAWYPLGAQCILDNQDPSGAWITSPWWEKTDQAVFNTWNTCFAILFLRHATRPLVASEDRR